VVTDAAGGRNVVARPAARVNHDDNQQGRGADRNSKYLHPTWCAWAAVRINHLRLLASRAIVKMNATCDKRQNVQNLVNEQSDADVRYGTIYSI
jgi:hypothetical protein